jgi:hypothetical protein
MALTSTAASPRTDVASSAPVRAKNHILLRLLLLLLLLLLQLLLVLLL